MKGGVIDFTLDGVFALPLGARLHEPVEELELLLLAYLVELVDEDGFHDPVVE